MTIMPKLRPPRPLPSRYGNVMGHRAGNVCHGPEFDRLMYLGNLLARWSEYELCKLHGRSFHLPQAVNRLAYDPNTGGTHVISTGVCYVPSTSPREHRIVDEFGFAFRALDSEHQCLIVVDHFGGVELIEDLRILPLNVSASNGRDGGESFLRGIVGGGSGIQARLDLAWGALDVEWRKRERGMRELRKKEGG